MNDQYYILADGEQTGPFTFDELIEKEPDIHTRILSPAEDTWMDACDLPELYDYFKEQGAYFPTEDNLASFWIRLGAFVIDFIILMILWDVIISVLISKGLVPNFMAYNSLNSISRAISKMPAGQRIWLEVLINALLIIYNSICEASAMRGSVGKRICRLIVVDADGLGISFPNALARSIGKVVSLQFYGIGFISIFWSEHKQALHDYVAKTYVIRREP